MLRNGQSDVLYLWLNLCAPRRPTRKGLLMLVSSVAPSYALNFSHKLDVFSRSSCAPYKGQNCVGAASDRGNYKPLERGVGSNNAVILHSCQHSVCAPVRAAPAEVHSATLALCHSCSFEDVRLSCHLGDYYFIKCFKHAFFAFLFYILS